MTIGMTQSLQGIERAQTEFNQAAASIAQGPVASTPRGDTVDLSSQAVALIQAKNSFEANIAAFKVGDQMTQDLLNSIK
jgi:flagellar hook protein FlgE